VTGCGSRGRPPLDRSGLGGLGRRLLVAQAADQVGDVGGLLLEVALVLLERLPELGLEGRIDIGNLYRLLRALEEEGLVSSEWSDELPGPAKRTYELTDDGRRVLDTWAEALRRARTTIGTFLDRYEEGR